ncbi:hypothetical protein [Sphingomonas alba]|uniref:Bacterial dipeptidyl-peptidase SH3 domain-containing protein n=1 Tax=Sphingomonas alba TaxID=2908208 RepID=A0ABT0RK35_9SPHN|nr:hypothetical protein [Sphingomonas alba]MCL6682960.1 hypothetical protein [Sphingomonas alba]
MKGSSAISAQAKKAAAGSARPSAKAGSKSGHASRRTPSAEGGYPLAGVSNPPDPDYYAYRQDLADVALAGQVIASHYAEPLLRHLVAAAPLRRAASDESEEIATLGAGDEMLFLDDTRGWAWGYAGTERRVGYVKAEALGL